MVLLDRILLLFVSLGFRTENRLILLNGIAYEYSVYVTGTYMQRKVCFVENIEYEIYRQTYL